MTESAALLVDEVLRRQPLRQGVLSLPFALRFLLATDPKVLSQVLGIACRGIASHLINLDSLGTWPVWRGWLATIGPSARICTADAEPLRVRHRRLVSIDREPVSISPCAPGTSLRR